MPKTLPSSLTDLRRSIVGGQMSTVQSLCIQDARIKNDKWNSVLQVLDRADTAQSDLPLSGVGLAHKDMFVMPDYRPLCGSKSCPDFSEDVSPLVKRLNLAGATTLGTLAMAEFAAGVTGENVNHPLPINPLDASLAVGGSSSGSGVAVAAGLCYGSLGTDTAGSVRIPAATCGVVGLKPTNGLLDGYGCFPLAPSLDAVGIVTRSVLDAAVLYAHTITSEQRASLMPDFTDMGNRLDDGTYNYPSLSKPVRIAAVYNHPNHRFNAIPAVRDAIMGVAEHFSCDQFRYHPFLEDLPKIVQMANTLLHVEAAVTHAQRLRSNPPALSAITRGLALPGAVIPGSWYAAAQQQRESIRELFLQRYFTNSDILLTPVLPLGIPRWESVLMESPHFELTALLALFSWTSFVNYLGLPAMVFPVAQDANGLPISIQAIARPYDESTLLAFAHQTERNLADFRSF